MPGVTDDLGLPYPLPTEVYKRQHIQDLAESTAFELSSQNTNRLAALQRPKGIIGSTLANTFTSDVVGYMSFNVDHLDNWSGGGRSITSTQGPTLSTGLYIMSFNAVITALSAAEASYAWITVEFERAGVRTIRRTFTPGQRAVRLSGPVRIPVGAGQQVKVRMLVNGTVGGSTMSFGRNNADASPRFAWALAAR